MTVHCTALHCTALHCTALHCTALQSTRAPVHQSTSAPVHQSTRAPVHQSPVHQCTGHLRTMKKMTVRTRIAVAERPMAR